MDLVSKFDFEGILEKNNNTRMFLVEENIIAIYNASSCVLINYENYFLFGSLQFKLPRT